MLDELVEHNEDAPEIVETTESAMPGEAVESNGAADLIAPKQEPTTEEEVLPEDAISQQSPYKPLPGAELGRRSPLIEEPAPNPPTPLQTIAPSLSGHSSKVSSSSSLLPLIYSFLVRLK